MEFTLPQLPYAYDALEPFIDNKTMETHYEKHHGGYVSNLNKAIAGISTTNNIHTLELEAIIENISRYPLAVRNNAGGHYNHSLFWLLLTPEKHIKPSDKLADAINTAFGSFEEFKKKFSEAATGRFGSGWAWLIKNSLGGLEICSTSNQDNPLMDIADIKGIPILGLDVWEHAYYLKYQNKRADYIDAWWNIVNWKEVEKRYTNSVVLKSKQENVQMAEMI